MTTTTPIPIRDRIQVYPVVATGARWPCRHEGDPPEQCGNHSLFARYPALRDDPRYADYGQCPDRPGFPVPGSRGGGLFPVLARTPSGRLACVMRTGASHKNTPGAEIGLSSSDDCGRTWSPYRVIAGGIPGQDWRNPAFGVVDDSTFVLAVGVLDRDSARRWIEVLVSKDAGETWERTGRLAEDEEPWLHPHGQVLQCSDGRLVFMARGAYSGAARRRQPGLPLREAFLYWSTDSGRHFGWRTYLGPVSETSLLQLDGDRWICYTRGTFGRDQAYVGRSTDDAETWKWEPAYPGARFRADFQGYTVPGTVLRLPSGRVLIVHTFRDFPFGVRAVLSRDNGANFDWKHPFVLTDTYWTFDSGYPSTVCCDDGTLVTVAYTLHDMAHPRWGTCAAAYVYHESAFD